MGKQARCPQCQVLNLVRSDPLIIKDQPEDPGKSAAGAFPGVTVNPYGEPGPSAYPVGQIARPTYQVAHRGGLILTLGILSIVCNVLLIPGILAWIMGRSDLRQMKRGAMDREGEGITQAGMIMGIIMTSLAALAIVFYIVMLIGMMLLAMSGNLH